MQPNVVRPRSIRHYVPARPVSVRVEDLLAERWGCTEGTAHQHMLHLARRTADVCHAMIQAGQYDRVIRYLEPVYNAVEVPLEQPLSLKDLIQKAQDSDAEEERAETRYLQDPTPANAKRWGRALAAHEHDSRQLRFALFRDREVEA